MEGLNLDDDLPADHPKNLKTVHEVILSDKDAKDFDDLDSTESLCGKLNKAMKLVKCYKKPELDWKNEEIKTNDVFYNTVRNGFVSALAMSYNHHLPLILSPGDIWLVVMQGFRVHMTMQQDKEFMKLTFKDMTKINKSVKR